MYIPDGVELTKAEQLEMASKKQEINYSNTRLKENPFDDAHSKETISGMVKAQVSVWGFGVSCAQKNSIDNFLSTFSGKSNYRSNWS